MPKIKVPSAIKRSTIKRLLSRVVLGLLLSAILFVVAAYLGYREPVYFGLLATDWRSVSFRVTSPTDIVPGSPTLFAFAQYVSGNTEKEATETDPRRGGMAVKASGAVTLIDISNWRWNVAYDPSSRRYYLRLSDGNSTFDYKPPFSTLPMSLSEEIVYKSEGRDTLQLNGVANNVGAVNGHQPGISMLTDIPSSFIWNAGEICSVNISRSYLDTSRNRLRLRLREYCTEERKPLQPHSFLASPWDQGWHYLLESDTSMIVLPVSLELKAEGKETISNSGANYLVLIQEPLDVSYSTGVEMEPSGEWTDLDIHLQNLNLISNPQDIDNLSFSHDLTSITTRSDRVSLQGIVGKMRTGLESTQLDELSQIEIYYLDYPRFKWDSNVVGSIDIAPSEQIYFSGDGIVDSVLVNGVEIIHTRWELIPEEGQGAIIGGFLGALLTAIGSLALEYRKKKRWDGHVTDQSEVEETTSASIPSRPTKDEAVFSSEQASPPNTSENPNVRGTLLATSLLLLVSFFAVFRWIWVRFPKARLRRYILGKSDRK